MSDPERCSPTGRHVLPRQRLVVATLALLLACEAAPSFSTAPADVTIGVAVYEHADYAGESALITEDIENLKNVRGPCVARSGGEETDVGWSDCISSIRVAPGWRATLYRDDGFRGEQLTVTSDVPNLTAMPGHCPRGGFNDCATAIRVFRAQ